MRFPRTRFLSLALVALSISAVGLTAPDAAGHASFVRTSATFASQTLRAGRIDLAATVARVQRGDSLAIEVTSFAACADSTATRADQHVHVFDEPADEQTIRRQMSLPRAARYEIEFELTSTGAELGATRQTTAFTTLEERSCP